MSGGGARTLPEAFPQTRGGEVRGGGKASLAAPKAEAAQKDAAGTRAPAAASTAEAVEAELRQFDLTSRYGPCIGLTRQER